MKARERERERQRDRERERERERDRERIRIYRQADGIEEEQIIGFISIDFLSFNSK